MLAEISCDVDYLMNDYENCFFLSCNQCEKWL